MFRVHMHLEFRCMSYWWSKFINHMMSVFHNELDYRFLKHIWFGVLLTLLKTEDAYNEQHQREEKNCVIIQGLVAFYKNHFRGLFFFKLEQN